MGKALRLAVLLLFATATFAQGPTPHEIDLSWTEPTATDPTIVVAGFNVYRGTTASGPYSKLNTTLIVPMVYADKTGVGGTKYFYVVTAVSANGGESAASNEIALTFLGNPAAPVASGVAK
jgi:fibronectin type 3 domain-containing protein